MWHTKLDSSILTKKEGLEILNKGFWISFKNQARTTWFRQRNFITGRSELRTFLKFIDERSFVKINKLLYSHSTFFASQKSNQPVIPHAPSNKNLKDKILSYTFPQCFQRSPTPTKRHLNKPLICQIFRVQRIQINENPKPASMYVRPNYT